MALPVYIHTLTVGETTISPTGPLDCGTAGDEHAARLCLRPETPDTDVLYRLEVVTGDGGYDITEPLTLEDGALTLDLPAAWSAAGVAAVRLIRFTEQDGKETARQYYPPFFLRFAYRDEGVGAAHAPYCWQQLLTRSESLLAAMSHTCATAEEHAAAAKAAAEQAAYNADAALRAEAAAEQAEAVAAYCEALIGLADSLGELAGVTV